MTVSLVRAGTTGDSDGSYHQILSAEQEPQVGLTLESGVWPREPVRLSYRATRKLPRWCFPGSGTLAANGQVVAFARPDWLETAPTVLHCCAGDSIEATNHGDQVAEVFVVQTRTRAASLHASTVRVTFRLNTGARASSRIPVTVSSGWSSTTATVRLKANWCWVKWLILRVDGAPIRPTHTLSRRSIIIDSVRPTDTDMASWETRSSRYGAETCWRSPKTAHIAR